jgi:hypothetical protein
MNERKPICSALSFIFLFSIGAIWFYLAILKPDGADPDSIDMGSAVEFFFLLCLLYPVGLGLVIASLIRRERFRIAAFACLSLYLLLAARLVYIWSTPLPLSHSVNLDNSVIPSKFFSHA